MRDKVQRRGMADEDEGYEGRGARGVRQERDLFFFKDQVCFFVDHCGGNGNKFNCRYYCRVRGIILVSPEFFCTASLPPPSPLAPSLSRSLAPLAPSLPVAPCSLTPHSLPYPPFQNKKNAIFQFPKNS
jgi:hypothetical protein